MPIHRSVMIKIRQRIEPMIRQWRQIHPVQLASLKTPPTSVKCIEWSVGSWGANDFPAIKNLMDTHDAKTDFKLSKMLYLPCKP